MTSLQSQNYPSESFLIIRANNFNHEKIFRPTQKLNRRVVIKSEPRHHLKSSSLKQAVVGQPKTKADADVGVGGVPGWSVVLISLAVALNVGVLVWLVTRSKRKPYKDHQQIATHES